MAPRPLNQQSGMPQMNVAFAGWTQRMTFYRVTQTTVDGFVEQVETPLTVQAVWQPLDPEEIKLKDEGQRSWEWIDLHIRGNALLFETNDRLLYEGVKFKVMAVKDYRLNNYVEYHLVKDYQ